MWAFGCSDKIRRGVLDRNIKVAKSRLIGRWAKVGAMSRTHQLGSLGERCINWRLGRSHDRPTFARYFECCRWYVSPATFLTHFH